MSDARMLETGTGAFLLENGNFRALESYAGAVVYTDDFNRADGNLTAPWVLDGLNYKILSNTCHRDASHGGRDFCQYGVDLGSPDMYVEADVGPNNAAWGSHFMCVNVRLSALEPATGYIAYINGSVNFYCEIGRSVASIYTVVASTSTTAVTNSPFRIRFEVQGSALRVYKDGVLMVSGTDSVITTGNYAGLNSDGASDGAGAYYDNFACGPL